FNHIEAENIKRGLQPASLRVFDEKDIAVDDHIHVIDKVKESDSSSRTVIGTADVNGITIRRAGEMHLDGAAIEQFGSTAELYRQLSIYYGEPINESTHIKVIHFTFMPFEEPQKLENVNVNDTTDISEIKLFADGGSRGNPGYSASGYILMTMQDAVLE